MSTTPEHDPVSPVERFAAIAEQGLCIGCGICEPLAGNDRIRMVNSGGTLRPSCIGDLDDDVVDRIYDVCPGTRTDGLPEHLISRSTTVDPVWGPWRSMVRAWAADPAVRHAGSTGGVLTALGRHLLSHELVSFVLHTTASSTEPSFGEATISRTPADVLAAAGSRYGPTATLVGIDKALEFGEPFAFIGKPCDIGALRNLARYDERVDALVRYWLTPVCGGFGTPAFTQRFLHSVGIEPGELTSLRYRGFGCPGPTVAATADRRVERHYLDFWGDDATAWQLPWRCKLCPDGIGEAADLAVSDTWPGGSPDREESRTDPGVNAIIARTQAGADLMHAAVEAGDLVIERTIDPMDMSDYQPHQVRKKIAVGARHEGLQRAGRIVPATNRLRITELRNEQPVEFRVRQADGTIERIADGKATEARPT